MMARMWDAAGSPLARFLSGPWVEDEPMAEGLSDEPDLFASVLPKPGFVRGIVVASVLSVLLWLAVTELVWWITS